MYDSIINDYQTHSLILNSNIKGLYFNNNRCSQDKEDGK